MRCLRTRNKTKQLSPGVMSENPEHKEQIESRCNAREPKSKGRVLIWAQCQRTRLKTKGSNLRAIQENPKQSEGIESERDVGESEIKERNRI